MRSYSRLKHAKIPFDTKAPILINPKHKLAELIVYHSHSKVLHRGVKQTLTEIRSNYWIPRGRNYVKRLLHSCVVCRKLNARHYEYPEHSDLPELRFDDKYPFSSTGVDYCGPLFCLPVYGHKDSTFKAWIVIYTCTATRAIILDVVNDMKAVTFISSFVRFISRRGCPNTIASDIGSVFTADETQSFMSNRYISWKFNLDCAPWFGGIWERLVACVKGCIKKIVGVKITTYIELQTLVCEIELLLNNRPLCAVYEDDYEDVLTPNHLTFGRRLETTSDGKPEIHIGKGVGLQKRKRFIDTLVDHFWNRWRKEYVTSLREYQRRTNVRHSEKVKMGDIVIIFDDKQPRHLWRMGKVFKLIVSGDGSTRGAEIKVAKTGHMIKRPVNKLYPLVMNTDAECNVNNLNSSEIDIENPSNKVDCPSSSIENNVGRKSKRDAAIVGELRRKFQNIDQTLG